MGADLVCAKQGSCVQVQVSGICRAESPVLDPLLYPVLQQQNSGFVSKNTIENRECWPDFR